MDGDQARAEEPQATRLARMMVTRLGMSNELGNMVYGQKEELIFLGREISEQRDYSEAVAEQIDVEVRKIVEDAYKVAKNTVKIPTPPAYPNKAR